MQANVHTPQRLAGESKKQYGERRQTSKNIGQLITLTGCYQPKGQTGREQHRDAMRKSGSMGKQAGAYGRGLRNNITRKQAALLVPKPH